MKKILIFILILVGMLGLIFYSEAQKLDVVGEVYFTVHDKDSPDYGQEKVIYAIQGETIQDKDIVNANTERVAQNTYKIYSGLPQFYDATGYWSQIEYQVLPKEEYDLLYKTVKIDWFIQEAMASILFASVDGYVARQGVTETWSTIRAGAGNSNDDTSATNPGVWLLTDGGTPSRMDRIVRSLYRFNTGDVIEASETVTSASFKFVVSNTGYLDELNQTIILDEKDLGTATALIDSDYDTSGWTTVNMGVNSPDMTTMVHNDSTYTGITLNASGLANIEEGAGNYTWFGLRASADFNNVDISGVGLNKSSKAVVYNSEQAGTTLDPYLLLVVASASGGGSSVSYASGSYYDLDITSKVFFNSWILFMATFIFPIWFFGKKLKRKAL